ncbi:uncharacterized protein BXZ73DRAFT_97046, partial [Epithele typhae]
GQLELWSGSLVNNQFVWAVMNTSPSNQTVNVSLLDIFTDQGAAFGSGTFTMYDLWQKDADGAWGAKVADVSGSMSVDVVTHGVRVFKAVPVSSSRRAAGEL